MQIIRHFPGEALQTTVYVPRLVKAPPPEVEAVEALPLPLRYLPWKYVREEGIGFTERRFRKALERADPSTTILTFWPDPSPDLLRYVKARGFTLVREMINSACAMSRAILEEAYARQGIAPAHHVTLEKVATETEELALYDHIVSPSSEVDRSLLELGIPECRLLRSSFGWHPDRFDASEPEPRTQVKLRFLFVGSIGVRKGVPELLRAWSALDRDAELVLVGDVEPSFAERFAQGLPDNVRHVSFTPDVGRFYKSADVFVFPSHEEGAPQVMYEAAGCGVPAITTPMGLARIVVDGRNGLVVPPGDVEALVAAMRTIVDRPDLRRALAEEARRSAADYTFEAVAKRRAAMLKNVLDNGGEAAPRRMAVARA